MLRELVVENYAVVERVRIPFYPGFNLLTGETGSGKSIVVDAFGLLLGGRASADMIRSGADRARVSGIFDAPSKLPEGIEADGDELLIEREILANGKSRAFLNSRPVAVGILKELAPCLGDIHGQNDQQLLLEAAYQRHLLDQAGGIRLEETAEAYRNWSHARAELARLEQQHREQLRQQDLWLFQRQEIETAALSPSEEQELAAERQRLSSVTRLTQLAAEAYAALYDSPESALAALRLAIKRCDELLRIDARLVETADALKAAALTLQEASYTLRNYLDGLEADPARLEQIESRLARIEKLKRKYGASVEEILAYGEQISRSLEELAAAGDQRRYWEEACAAAAARFEQAARKVTAARVAAARKFEQDLAAALQPLAMERTRVIVQIQPAAWSAEGWDQLEFLISPNAGEEPRPLARTLSGGELSRLALAIKTVTDGGPAGRTLVFDEVDAGIGGAVAEAVGRRLKQVAAANQVLCVTHLAQIASFGDHHFVVRKTEVGGRTVATVEELTREGRIQELGRMLAGQRLTPEALKHAEQLLAELA